MACSISHASKPAAHLIQATPLASDGWRFGVVAKAYGAGRAAAGKQAKCSAPSTRREEAEPAAASTALVPIDRTHAVDLQVIDEKPAEIIERFPRGREAKSQSTRTVGRCVVGLHAVVF